MTDISPAKKMIQVEEAKYNAAVAESTMNRVGSSINFINTYQYDEKSFVFNNDLNAFEIGLEYADGALFIAQNMEIVGYGMYLAESGTSGTLELDIMRQTAPNGAPVSIFSTTPKLTYQAADRAYMMKVLVPTQTTDQPALGATQGVFAVTNLDKFDLLFAKIISVPANSKDAGLTLFLRPR